MSVSDYERARKLGLQSYRHEVTRGRYPYLPALEEMVSGLPAMKEEAVGVCEIPIYLVCGTLTQGRQEAFAKNYMPILPEDSEFAAKWIHLLGYQQSEGISDPVTACEFMGRFYIQEGNKRVSVLKYLEQPDIPADVTRILLPDDNSSKEAKIYREFLAFFECTGIYGIYFSGEGYYAKLAGLFGMTLGERWPDDAVLSLKSEFFTFSRLYAEHCGGNSALTYGDAFMIYAGTFTPGRLLDDSDDEIRGKLGQIWPGHVGLLERLKEFCGF
ncbi:MAG: hypothetical protein IJG37_00025 [Synergistaceae bacterium]|nr:hypothetical protein [Synergistaceae bacterium]